MKRNKENSKDYKEKITETDLDLADVLEFLPDPAFIINAEGEIIFWNAAIEELTGIKASAILGQKSREYSIPFYGFNRPMLIDLALNPQKDYENKYEYFLKNKEIITAEVYSPHVRKGGAYLWAKARRLYNSEGKIIGAIEIIRDITEKKRNENELRESEKNLIERIKEIQCLYKIIKLINNPIMAVDDMLIGTVQLIPNAFQFPELITARIQFGKKPYSTTDFKESPWFISYQSTVYDKNLKISVYHIEDQLFLQEEKRLLKKIVEQLKTVLELKLGILK